MHSKKLIGFCVILFSPLLFATYPFHPFDPQGPYPSDQVRKLCKIIHRYSPNCKVNDHMGNITYYFSTPMCESFPIVIFCSGSTSRETVTSIYPIHHYFWENFSDIGVGWVTLEHSWIAIGYVHRDHFMKYYTRTQRLHDHQQIIAHLLQKPPKGWNGKFIFFGVSEGGCLVTALTEAYTDQTLATINASGANGWNWPTEVWNFLENMRETFHNHAPWYFRLRGTLPDWCPGSLDLRWPTTRAECNQILAEMLQNPVPNRTWIGMSYRYHADAIRWPKTNFSKLKTPYLVIAGDQDPAIGSSNAFVQQAKKSGVNITYLRFKGVGHQVGREPKAIESIRSWLQTVLAASPE